MKNFITPPSYWKRESMTGDFSQYASSWRHPLAGLFVMGSLSSFKDGTQAIHVSVSRKDRLPSWDEISKVKNEFIGEDVTAFHMIPKREDYVNLHVYCIHVWSEKFGKDLPSLPNLKDLVFEKAI